MYELRVERVFCAAHAILIKGQREPRHGHNWGVSLVVQGSRLNEDGLLCDFHLLERRLDAVIGRFHNNDLNTTPPFDRINPTAEHVARHIADEMAGADVLPSGVQLVSVSVTEAPGCIATYRASSQS